MSASLAAPTTSQDIAEADALHRQTAAHENLSDCPLIDGNAIRLLPSAQATLAAMFDAMAAARDHIHLEYYTLEDVRSEGRALSELLSMKLQQGVRVAILYDAIGSKSAPDALFDGLARAGAQVVEYQPLNPRRRHFSFHVNYRDHRKILVVDGRVAFLGGVNLARAYENPPEAGVPADGNTEHAFWRDAAAQIEGPAVAEIQKLFLHTWTQQGGAHLRADTFPPLRPMGDETIRVEGSAPRERRQLYYVSLHAAVAAARHSIDLSTGYFVPTHREWKLLADAAQRGVTVRLLLPGFSDVPGAIHAARGLYGRLLRHGVHIFEVRDAAWHAKVATIDGVWTAIGSSNLDRRSVVYNNEIDAIVLGRATAMQVQALLRREMDRAEPITLQGWKSRSLHEHLGEWAARIWERYM
jgi:cardiolipin synthase